jgi:hypothetical protein
MATTIYRIENEIGAGPYSVKSRLSSELYAILASHGNIENWKRTPGPFDDPYEDYLNGSRPLIAKNEKFGFIDVESMNRWFTKHELSLLEREKFFPTILIVSEIKWIGLSGQCSFLIEDVIRRAHLSGP